ncbi:MAG: efflux RND transporter periplasmic adaptor subunit, partial [Planctomycetes bacterium]|nr:efflux RND transporter periplasmic adaptor subunit [Planctomycetota bacterium]
VDGIRRVKAGMEIKPIVVPMEKQEAQPASMGDQSEDKKQDATSEEKDG